MTNVLGHQFAMYGIIGTSNKPRGIQKYRSHIETKWHKIKIIIDHEIRACHSHLHVKGFQMSPNMIYVLGLSLALYLGLQRS